MVAHPPIIDRSIPDRCGEPVHCHRPVAVEGALHAGVVADSGQPRDDGVGSSSSAGDRQLGCRDPANAAELRIQGETAIGNADLGTLGGPAFAEFVPIQETKRSILRLRPSELTRLLNSTPLGTVTSERRLYRDRQKAGYRIGEQRWVDLVRYTAWLAAERHAVKSVQPSEKPLSKKRGRITKQQVMGLLNAQSFCCGLTGWELTPHTAALDHRMPVSRGGEHTIANAQVLHEVVNRAKGTLTNEEFITLCRAVVSHAEATAPQPNKEQP